MLKVPTPTAADMEHHNLIQHYEGVVPDNVCDWLVGALEGADGLVHRNLGPQDFYELNINESHPEVVSGCVALLKEALRRYQMTFPLQTGYFPSELGLEEFRVKRYTGGTGQEFGDHVDVGDRASAKGILPSSFILTMTLRVDRLSFILALSRNLSKVLLWCSHLCGCILTEVCLY